MRNIKSTSEIFTDKDTKQAFLEMWENTNCMDIYEGNLKQYFQTIGSVLKRNTDKINLLNKQLNRIGEIVNERRW